MTEKISAMNEHNKENYKKILDAKKCNVMKKEKYACV